MSRSGEPRRPRRAAIAQRPTTTGTSRIDRGSTHARRTAAQAARRSVERVRRCAIRIRRRLDVADATASSQDLGPDAIRRSVDDAAMPRAAMRGHDLAPAIAEVLERRRDDERTRSLLRRASAAAAHRARRARRAALRDAADAASSTPRTSKLAPPTRSRAATRARSGSNAALGARRRGSRADRRTAASFAEPRPRRSRAAIQRAAIDSRARLRARQSRAGDRSGNAENLGVMNSLVRFYPTSAHPRCPCTSADLVTASRSNRW